MEKKKIRVFLADDHAVVLEGLVSLLSHEGDMEVVGKAVDGAEVLDAMKKSNPDVAVLDLSLPCESGVSIARKARKDLPRTRLLALTMHEEKHLVRDFFLSGGHAFLLKRSASDEIARAIRAVASGETYIDPAIGHPFLLMQRSRPDVKKTLTAREEGVLKLLARGFSQKEVAARLQISIKTVETYKTRSMQKLGLKSRVEMINYALEKGWLHDSQV